MRPTPQQSRLLGLWTAAWLFALLLVLLLWLGDVSLQWPVLLVPVVWALVALRRGRGRPVRRRDDDAWPPPGRDDAWPSPGRENSRPLSAGLADWPAVEPPDRRPPPTRELPWLPEAPRDRREE